MNLTLCRGVMAVAALLIAIATGLGAWASHGLQSMLDQSALRAFETAVTYQLVHALGLFVVGVLGMRQGRGNALAPGALVLLAGIVLFCGGIYASSLGGPEWLSSVAPAGGIGLIVGWIAIGAGVWLSRAGERGSAI